MKRAATILVTVLSLFMWSYALWGQRAETQTLEERCQAYKDQAGKNLSKIDLNTTTEEDMLNLPGIGVKTARAIVNQRKAIGGFKSLEQLRLVREVGPKLFNCLKDLVTVGRPKE